jgi:hypothetical protein
MLLTIYTVLVLRGPIRSAANSRNAAILLRLRVDRVRCAAYLPLAVEPRHWFHLIHRVFVALQSSGCGEEETFREWCRGFSTSLIHNFVIIRNHKTAVRINSPIKWNATISIGGHEDGVVGAIVEHERELAVDVSDDLIRRVRSPVSQCPVSLDDDVDLGGALVVQPVLLLQHRDVLDRALEQAEYLVRRREQPGEEGALAVGGVGEGVGAAGAEGDGDGAGARVAEPLGEPRRAVPRRPGMPEPLRARRHRPIEHRQHPFSPSQRSPPRVASSPDPIVRHPPRAVHDRCSSAGELYTEGVWR